MEPASIRYKNPGAMWGKGNPIAKKWGSTATVMLSDGKGQGNNIAVFPTFVKGICAQLDMWRTSVHYRNKRFADAIATWSGHNNVPSYIAYVKARVPGISEDTIMNDNFWRSSMGVAFLKAQAGHEAGKTYPAPPQDWLTAQAAVFSSKQPASDVVKSTTTAIATNSVTGSTAVAVHHSGAPLWAVALVILLGIGVAVFAAWFFHRDPPEIKDDPEAG